MSLKAKLTHTNAGLWSPFFLRIVLGCIMAGHGSQKLFGWFGGYGFHNTAAFFDKLGLHPGNVMAGLAGGGEVLGGVLFILGLFTRFAALDVIVIMIVAIKSTYDGQILMTGPGTGIDLPLAVLAGSLILLEVGGGALSVDSKLGGGGAKK